MNKKTLTFCKTPLPDYRLDHCTTEYAWIQNYLDSSNEKTVIIMTSKVAQKSYGTEKRFLCPPPTVTLVGSSWWTVSKEKSLAPNMTICISGDHAEQQQGRIEWYDTLGTVIGQTGNKAQKKPTEDWIQASSHPLAGGRSVLKRLYINDADEKRKKVECLIQLQLDDYPLGTLSSRAIKVISKPSKKRQSVKNVELCIYHGTPISLFNRIRSQTVSTKYLGVSLEEAFDYPGQHTSSSPPTADTCFVARTGTWNPFVIWIVDTQTDNKAAYTVNDYIGCPSLSPNIPYPTPPTIALKNKTNQPMAVRYNQPIVIQCLTTGLVSPVMIIRKVEKAATVVGGARCPQGIHTMFSEDTNRGGEMGDEVLGDPVSQLHKVALQIIQPGTSPYAPQEDTMMPQTTQAQTTYLACLNDLVGTHTTACRRSPIKPNTGFPAFDLDSLRSMADHASGVYPPPRRRVSETYRSPYPTPAHLFQRSRSISSGEERQEDSQALAEYGAYWAEDISDAAVWTIVGTECALYTFWTPPQLSQLNPRSSFFPYITQMTLTQKRENWVMTLAGENLARDLQVWFGDVKASFTEYRSRDLIVCGLPSRDQLLQSVSLTRMEDNYSIQVLLVRKDGVVYKTHQVYSFR
ncbi:hypothetical protein EDC96DRAFT_434095 [Choanephora cucurbitarum]|nr:hypothetical protein EDC96DRAFT_434095 [Choanephora cucurbitarum]